MFPSLDEFKKLCGNEFIDNLVLERKKLAECKRQRILGTIEMLWLFIGIAANSNLQSLFEIIQNSQNNNSLKASVSVAAFCKSRDKFSPKFLLKLWKNIIDKIKANDHCNNYMWRNFSLIAIDKCTLMLPEKKHLYAQFKAHRTGKSDSVGPIAVEICCLFDAMLRIPICLTLDKSNTSEFKLFPRLVKYLKKTI